MTAPARISQADMERATKAVKAADLKCVRIIMDLANQKIEVIIGDDAAPLPKHNPWDDE